MSTTHTEHDVPAANIPAYVTRMIATSHLVVAGTNNVAKGGASQFTDNLKSIGMLQSPIVELISGDIGHVDATYRVIAGRRRVLGALRAGLDSVECRIYLELTDKQKALIVLSENMHRSAAWVEELKAIAKLVADGIGMSDREIAKELGVSVSTIRERMSCLRLHTTLLEAIFDGHVSRDMSRQLCRLSNNQQEKLVAAYDAGVELTSDLVTATLRAQINEGLATLTLPTNSETAEETAAAAAEEKPVYSQDYKHMVGTLESWEYQFKERMTWMKACMLMKTLRQEITMLQEKEGITDGKS